MSQGIADAAPSPAEAKTVAGCVREMRRAPRPAGAVEGQHARLCRCFVEGPPLWSARARNAERAQRQALKFGGMAVYSILRDWVKGQVTAIEIGMLTFEAGFLSHILLANGETVIGHMQHQKLLPQEKANG